MAQAVREVHAEHGVQQSPARPAPAPSDTSTQPNSHASIGAAVTAGAVQPAAVGVSSRCPMAAAAAIRAHAARLEERSPTTAWPAPAPATAAAAGRGSAQQRLLEAGQPAQPSLSCSSPTAAAAIAMSPHSTRADDMDSETDRIGREAMVEFAGCKRARPASEAAPCAEATEDGVVAKRQRPGLNPVSEAWSGDGGGRGGDPSAPKPSKGEAITADGVNGWAGAGADAAGEGAWEGSAEGSGGDEEVGSDGGGSGRASQGEDEGAGEETGVDWRANDCACALCDDGGVIIYCDGTCMRAFHAGADDREGARTHAPDICNPLACPEDLFDVLDDKQMDESFQCPNCLAAEHQCFVCKLEGPAHDSKERVKRCGSGQAPVFRCGVAGCGKYYHSRCLPDFLAEDIENGLFLCPMHKCAACGEAVQEGNELVPCRRCPVAYHRTCIPPQLLHHDPLDPARCPRRVWLTEIDPATGKSVSGVDKSLLYCLKHPIPLGFETPPHTRPLIHPLLAERWRLHYALRHAHLESSKRLLRDPEGPGPGAMLPPPARERGAAAAAAAGVQAGAGPPREASSVFGSRGSDSDSEEGGGMDDVPLGQRLHKRVPDARASAPAGTRGPPRAPAGQGPTQGQQKRRAAPAAGAAAQGPAEGSREETHKAPQEGAKPGAGVRRPAKQLEEQARGAAAREQPPGVIPSMHSASPSLYVAPTPTPSEGAEPRAAGEGPDAGAAAPAHTAALPLVFSAGVGGVELPQSPFVETAAAEGPEERGAGLDGVESAVAMEEDFLPFAEAGIEQEAMAAAPAPAAAPEEPRRRAAVDPRGPTDGGAQVVEASAVLDFVRRSAWKEPAMLARCRQHLMRELKARTLEAQRACTRIPSQHYTQARENTVDQARLEMLKKAVQLAEDNPALAGTVLGVEVAKELFHHEDHSRMQLQPFLHGERYTSYGRHFTKREHMKKLCERLVPFLLPGDTVVDFSCGSNEFVPLLKRLCAEDGWEVYGRGYDIITPANMEDVEVKSWFDVKQGDLPCGDRLVVGLNPPFGKESGVGGDFAEHAARQFRPRLIVLIVPPSVPAPQGYCLLWEDGEMMKDRAFYVPGTRSESWNTVTPPVRVYVRNDCYDRVAGWSDERHFRTVAMRELSRPLALVLGALAGGGMGVPLQQGSQGFPVLGGGLGGRGLGVPLQQGSQGFPVLSAGSVLPPQVPLMPHLLL